jgi:hypothetical protein
VHCDGENEQRGPAGIRIERSCHASKCPAKQHDAQHDQNLFRYKRRNDHFQHYEQNGLEKVRRNAATQDKIAAPSRSIRDEIACHLRVIQMERAILTRECGWDQDRGGEDA